MVISLCSWHVEKDIRERLMARDLENVHNRTSHAWTQFAEHSELGFIDINFLERYRQKRKDIVRKRIEEAELNGETLSGDEDGQKEPTVLNKDSIKHIQSLMRKHRQWHPFKFPSTMPILENGSPVTPRYIWLRQATEMHARCREFNEGYAWEYLWNNWYRWDKWQLWARAASIDYYPIIQTNAPVETHWNQLKNYALLWFNRISIDHLCAVIQNNFLPLRINTIHQYRKHIKACSWHDDMVSDWKDLEMKITNENDKDLADAEAQSIDPIAENSPMQQ